MKRTVAVSMMVLGFGLAAPAVAMADDVPAVSMPGNYVYNPDLGSLHDYCTWSEDQAQIDNRELKRETVDFRSSCAWHDLCYMNNGSAGKEGCDSQFYTDLIQQCNHTFPNDDSGFLAGCSNRAEAYYQAVRAFGNP